MGKKRGTVFAAALFFAMGIFPALSAEKADVAWADDLRRVNRISLKFETDIRPGMDFGDETIEISAASDRYYVEDYRILNNGFIWENRMEPRIEVTLMPSDGWYFGSIGRDEITLKGGGALYCRSQAGMGDSMEIELTLTPLNRYMEPLSGLTLDGEGVASWNPVENAGAYELRVYRDGKVFGDTVKVTGTRFNCWQRLAYSGSYFAEVRPVNRADTEVKGDWARSGELLVDGQMAAVFQGKPFMGEDGQLTQAAWRQASDGRWWYDYGDGTWPANCWEEIQGKWYFFDPEGYMKTGWFMWQDRWYYCTEKGYMLRDCITEDGYWLGEDGALIPQ